MKNIFYHFYRAFNDSNKSSFFRWWKSDFNFDLLGDLPRPKDLGDVQSISFAITNVITNQLISFPLTGTLAFNFKMI